MRLALSGISVVVAVIGVFLLAFGHLNEGVPVMAGAGILGILSWSYAPEENED